MGDKTDSDISRQIALGICSVCKFGVRVINSELLPLSLFAASYYIMDKVKKDRNLQLPKIKKLIKDPTPFPNQTKTHINDFNFPDIASGNNVLVIGVAGGSGSGKTTYSKAIFNEFGEENLAYLIHDAYYRDQSHLSKEDRNKVNFDHPDTLETSLLIEHIQSLKKNVSVNIPIYDFATHTRKSETIKQEPKHIILVEGILIFSDPVLYNLLDMKIFIKTDDDIRLIRRMRRDIEERGRDVAGVVDQYLETVRPMHQQYVEPSMKNADIIVPEGMNNVALDLVVHRLSVYINKMQGNTTTTATAE